MATPRKEPSEKQKTGRKPKTEVDPDLAQRICDNLELGMPITLAAEAEGVHRVTVYRWIEQFPEFAQRVTRARARGGKNLVVRSLGGGEGSSNANWHLERRYREDYGAVTKIINETPDDFSGKTREELEAERARLAVKEAAARAAKAPDAK